MKAKDIIESINKVINEVGPEAGFKMGAVRDHGYKIEPASGKPGFNLIKKWFSPSDFTWKFVPVEYYATKEEAEKEAKRFSNDIDY